MVKLNCYACVLLQVYLNCSWNRVLGYSEGKMMTCFLLCITDGTIWYFRTQKGWEIKVSLITTEQDIFYPLLKLIMKLYAKAELCDYSSNYKSSI